MYYDKTPIVWMLVGLNAVLLLGVVLSLMIPPAHAQARGGRGYLLLPAKFQTNTEALWVIDQSARTMGLFTFNSRGNLEGIGRRNLEKDFRAN